MWPHSLCLTLCSLVSYIVKVLISSHWYSLVIFVALSQVCLVWCFLVPDCEIRFFVRLFSACNYDTTFQMKNPSTTYSPPIQLFLYFLVWFIVDENDFILKPPQEHVWKFYLTVCVFTWYVICVYKPQLLSKTSLYFINHLKAREL